MVECYTAKRAANDFRRNAGELYERYRSDIDEVCKPMGIRARYRMLSLRKGRQQLPADQLGGRFQSLQLRGRLAALCWSGGFQRLRLYRGREWRQRWDHSGGAPDADEPVGDGSVIFHPGH